MHSNIYICSKAALNQPIVGLTLSGPFSEVVGIGSRNIVTMVLHRWCYTKRYKAIDIGEWSICGGARLERLYCIYIKSSADTCQLHPVQARMPQVAPPVRGWVSWSVLIMITIPISILP